MDNFINRLGGIEEQLRGHEEISQNVQFFEYLARRVDILPQGRQRELREHFLHKIEEVEMEIEAEE